MKNVLFCLDSFKGTLSTFDIISISKQVIDSKYKSYFNGVYLPIADGGEGSLDIILAILEGKTIYVDSIDAEYNAINAPYFLSKDNDVYIEVAKIVGLPYLTNKIPSFVELPPKNIFIDLGLCLKASKITIPIPLVVLSNDGILFVRYGSPTILATSI